MQPPEPSWAATRMELRAWFQRNAPSLGELYEGAVRLIFDTRVPGRVRFVSHAISEIRNRLPGIVSGNRAGGRLDYTSRLDEIVKAWRRARLSLDGSVPI